MFLNIYKSFKNATKGIAFALKYERNFRIHITALFYVFCFSLIYGLNETQLAVIFAVFSLVLFAELINTSMEALVNMQTACYNTFAKIAKDIAAGAVMITAMFSVVIAVLFFKEFSGWQRVYNFFASYPILIVIFFISIFFALKFVKGRKG